MMNIHDRIEHIILQEKLSIAAFERQIGVGRNSLSTSLRKQSVISHEVIIKIFEHFPRYSLDWMFFGNKKPEDIEIEKLSAEIINSNKRWRDLSDKNI
jgi:plasmid maintenance system antidote protein VapI